MSSLFKNEMCLGYGMVLELRKQDGTVWVASRLLNSPAGRAQVKLFSQVLEIQGSLMRFSSLNEFRNWAKNSPPRANIEESFLFGDGSRVYLIPEPVEKDIPVYWSPNQNQTILRNHHALSRGLEYCEKTGQYIHTGKIKIEAIMEALADH